MASYAFSWYAYEESMDQSQEKLNTYAAFWPYYLKEHSKPATMWMHALGTLLGALVFFIFVATGRWEGLLICPVIGYGFAWYSHFVIQKNKPATFQYPLWSFISDWRLMCAFISWSYTSGDGEVSLRKNA